MDPWTFVTLRHRVDTPEDRDRKPVPRPAKETAHATARRRASQAEARREIARRRQQAIENFKAAHGVTRLPSKPGPSPILEDLQRNPPQSISEGLDRYWRRD